VAVTLVVVMPNVPGNQRAFITIDSASGARRLCGLVVSVSLRARTGLQNQNVTVATGVLGLYWGVSAAAPVSRTVLKATEFAVGPPVFVNRSL
jgi:hypothetical protein